MSRPAALRYFHRAGYLLALIFAVLLVVQLVRSSLEAGLPREILLGIPGIFWVAAPILFAAAFVGASSTRLGAAAFLTLELALIASVAAVLLWGDPLGLVFLPILQAIAITVAFLIALALGWRMRPDFLKD